ncbi:MAG: aconitase X catalytic domain-containing protein [Desulfurococcaceae archaeon]|jgi:predicted aconitase
MYLTREQEKMLSGEYGWAVAKAMEILVRVGEAMGADSLIKVVHAHVAGVSFSTIGKHGLELIGEFYKAGGRARVFTTINPGCIDYSGFSRLIDNAYESEQRLIDAALEGMGFRPVHTCVPYYYRPPSPGEHLAWSESSAVIIANSVYGARTNREGGLLALAASLTGYTYRAGLHLDENRVVRVLLKIDPGIRPGYYGALGLWIGESIRKAPLVTGAPKKVDYVLRNMLAAAAASGNHALVALEGVTPPRTFKAEIEERVFVEKGDIEKYIFNPPKSTSSEILGYLGCPHMLPEDLLYVVKLLRKYGPVKRGKLLLTVPREFTTKYSALVREAAALGADIAAGTCPVVSTPRRKFDYIITSSGKSYFYLSKIHRTRVGIASDEEVVKYVCGVYG